MRKTQNEELQNLFSSRTRCRRTPRGGIFSLGYNNAFTFFPFSICNLENARSKCEGVLVKIKVRQGHAGTKPIPQVEAPRVGCDARALCVWLCKIQLIMTAGVFFT